MWFRNLPLRAKFGLLIGVILSAFVMAAFVGERQFTKLNHIIAELDTNRLPSVQHLSTMRSALADYRIYEYRHVVTSEERQLARVEALMAGERAKFIAAEQSFIKIITDAVEDSLYKKFKATETAYLLAHERFMTFSRSDKSSDAQHVVAQESRPLYDTCRTQLQALIDYNVRLAADLNTAGTHVRRSIAIWSVMLGVLLLIAVFAMYWVVQQMIARPILLLGTAMQQAETGRYHQGNIVLSYQASDEIGGLISSYRRMIQHIGTTTEEIRLRNEEIIRQQRIMEVQAQYLERANASLRQNNIDLRQFMQREFLRVEELTRHKETLVSIAYSEHLHSGDIKAAFRLITEQAALHLDVARVSIWLVRSGRGYIGTPQLSELELIDLFDASKQTHTDKGWLSQADYPKYFEALETLDIIDAADAISDERTKEFTEKYLHPHGITAMLDVPVRSGNTSVGVLCVEHIGGKRVWRLEEEIFARNLANFVVTALDAREKMRQRERLSDLNRELLLVNTDMQEKNTALQNAQEAAAQTLLYINHQNQLLETKTHELAEANKALQEKQALMEEINRLLADAQKQMNLQNELLQKKGEETFLNLLTLKDENSMLRYNHDELQTAYAEIKRQHEMLEHQANHASTMASELQSKNELLLKANTELSEVYRELRRQNELLQEQAVTIEEANTKLQEKNLQLTRIDQEKNNMLGIVAHDLRNPLSSIMLGAAFLKRIHGRGQMTDEDMIRHLTRIEETSERMNTIISELLDLNAIETGKMVMNMTQIELCGLMSIVADDFAKRAEGKNIELLLQTPATPINLQTDGRIIRQILDNLVSNAVKFSPKGKKVTLEVADSEAAVKIAIHDEGPGITAEDRQHLFQRFSRLSAKPTAGEPSTGLGLSIVQKFVETLGGKVRCESSPETGRVGASFIIEFPTTSPQASDRS